MGVGAGLAVGGVRVSPWSRVAYVLLDCDVRDGWLHGLLCCCWWVGGCVCVQCTQIELICCATFLVSRERVLARPLKFWEILFKYSYEV